ncbi:MAG: HD domain-containing protein [Rickettsia sp.]|jgi:(p)ppGpp synthase/HD superfamily hydrolase|nr:HD domain-containing protein [Rickettsia sp.]
MNDINCWQSKFQSCSYSDSLLDKLLKLNSRVNCPIDINEVTKAIYYARKYHGYQMRQSGEPYYSHPIEVAYMLANYIALKIPRLFRTDMIITALLHDTIEDTTLTEQMIAKIFGSKVASQVEDLTRVKPYGKISSKEILDLLVQQEKLDVALIKIFDRIHNLETLGAKSIEKARKIIEETMTYFITLAIYLEIPTVKQQMLDLCYQHLDLKQSYQPKEMIFEDNVQLFSLVLKNAKERRQSQQLLES